MTEEVSFLKELLITNSVNPPGNEKKVAEIIAKKLEENGIECNLRSLGPDRAYLTARIKGNGNKKSLAFSGHMDTVPPGDIPWDYDPFGGQEVDGKLYGRGASDMKSGLAALAMAMVEIAREGIPLEGDLVLAATAGEEVDTLGARTMIEDGVLKDTGAMIIGEPSNNELFIAHKGALWLEITSYGKTAHGSMPDQGINAIVHMNTFINALHDNFKFKFKEDKLLGGPTMNFGVISGGVNTNVVPDVCRLQIDMRTVPGMEHREIIADITSLMKEIENGSTARFDLKVLNDLMAVGTPAEDELIKLAKSVSEEISGTERQLKGVRYYTDASTFVKGLGEGLPVLIYGPGVETMAHKPNEHVEISKYLEAIKFYKKVALEYLK